MKKAARILAVFILALAVFLPVKTFAAEIIVVIETLEVDFPDQQPVIVDGRTLVPVRAVFEALWFDVGWDAEAQVSTLYRWGNLIEITIGSYEFTLNGQAFPLDVPAQIINGRTMLPIRALPESLGYTVDWHPNYGVIEITEPPFTLDDLWPDGIDWDYILQDPEFYIVMEEMRESIREMAYNLGVSADAFDEISDTELLAMSYADMAEILGVDPLDFFAIYSGYDIERVLYEIDFLLQILDLTIDDVLHLSMMEWAGILGELFFNLLHDLQEVLP